MSARPPAAERLAVEGAFLSRSDLAALGLERRAVDAVFRHCPVVVLPGYSRPLIRVEDYRAFLAEHTYSGDRVRPQVLPLFATGRSISKCSVYDERFLLW